MRCKIDMFYFLQFAKRRISCFSKLFASLICLGLLILTTSCAGLEGIIPAIENIGDMVRSTEMDSQEALIFSPYGSSEYVGLDYSQVEVLLQNAGFEKITANPIEDINSHSGISDGTVESVTINGLNEFSSTTGFNKEAEVIIVFHSIPKIPIPITPDEAASMHYLDVGRLFFDSGFTSIETDEVYDLSTGANSKTVITLNGIEISNETQLPYDADIRIIEHFPKSKYMTTINIDFEGNWIFSKYNVDVVLSEKTLGTLKHGESGKCEVELPAGSYELRFSKEGDSSVFGSVTLQVESDTEVDYHIACNRKAVEVDETKFINAASNNKLVMPYNTSHYLRKNYQIVVDELKKVGFSSVEAKATTDSFWAPDDLDSVVSLEVAGKTSINHDDLCDKSANVTVYYHIADFAFVQENVDITEKETFELAYTLTSGDTIDSISIAIDNEDVLKRNEDGSFTALIPGSAIVTASAGDHIYSQCVVNVAEIIVPIDKIEFSASDIDVSVGSTFSLEYTVLPDNANYRDIRVETSNKLLEMEADSTFYSSGEGDTSIMLYQDERLLGSCTVHAAVVQIDDVSILDEVNEIFIGDSAELRFRLFPENATNKGVSVSSSDTRIAEAIFDERGTQIIKIVGKKAGSAVITIKTPQGNKYTHEVLVKEIVPTGIAIATSRDLQRIEVGTPLAFDVIWQPESTSIKELTWSSSNNKVVKVGKDGSLEAVGVGTAELTAKHKSGITTSISITVEPTIVESIAVSADRDNTKKFVKGDKFTILVAFSPENATDKSLSFSSSNESVAKVSNRGVVTATGAGTATITIESPDGPKKTLSVTVSQSPQKFKITWSASLTSNDHVGSSWSKGFFVNGEKFGSGSTFVLDPETSFTVEFIAQEADTRPDVGSYYERINYSDDLCENGYSVSDTVLVYENGGRYSGNCATWSFKMKISPVN